MDEYELFESPEHGDIVEVVPGKFFAFKGPIDLHGADSRRMLRDRDGVREFAPSFYVDIFRSLNVTAVVRHNCPTRGPSSTRVSRTSTSFSRTAPRPGSSDRRLPPNRRRWRRRPSPSCSGQ